MAVQHKWSVVVSFHGRKSACRQLIKFSWQHEDVGPYGLPSRHDYARGCVALELHSFKTKKIMMFI